MSEWIRLKTSLHAFTEAEKRYWCGHCQYNKYNDPKMLQIEMDALGCEIVDQKVRHKLLLDDGLIGHFKTCPGNVAQPWVTEYIAMYQAYEKGYLPYSGSYLEQPNKIIEILSVIGHHFSTIRERDHHKRLKKAELGRRSKN